MPEGEKDPVDNPEGRRVPVGSADQIQKLKLQKDQIVARMRHVQRLESLGVIAGGIAHDFNNLLSVIMGNADIIASEAQGQQLLIHCCSEIQKAAKRSTELVAQILAYSGGGKFIVDAVNISSLVEEMAAFLESIVPQGTSITLKLASNLPEVSGGVEQMRQVISNLVSGASDAIGEGGGEIQIETGIVSVSSEYLRNLYFEDSLSPGPYVFLEVRDSGRALEEGMVEKLFDPASISKLGDRGLGLSAALGVVRAHKGGARIIRLPNEGTTVRVYFPALIEYEYTDFDDNRVGGLLDSRPGRGRILLVDDEEMVRALGEIILEQNGFSVVTAQDGDEAIAAYEANADNLSLVLLDMSMPKRDGYEVARAMRAIRADTPIVLCTGHVGIETRSRFAELQVDGYLQKPYHLNELLEIVESLVQPYDE